jgi:hypothetical protein
MLEHASLPSGTSKLSFPSRGIIIVMHAGACIPSIWQLQTLAVSLSRSMLEHASSLSGNSKNFSFLSQCHSCGTCSSMHTLHPAIPQCPCPSLIANYVSPSYHHSNYQNRRSQNRRSCSLCSFIGYSHGIMCYTSTITRLHSSLSEDSETVSLYRKVQAKALVFQSVSNEPLESRNYKHVTIIHRV